MSDRVDVSIVMPIGGFSPFLEYALASAKKQSHKSKEIICVLDNGITEELKPIMDEFDCIWLTGDGNGAGSARNIGLNIAKGKYIVFWDSDDFFKENLIEEAYLKMEKEDLDICIWDVYEYDNKTNGVIEKTQHLVEELQPEEDVFSGDNEKYILNFTSGAPWNKMFRRDFIVNNKLVFMEQKCFNDIFFVQAAIVHAKKIAVLQKKLMFYRINNEFSLQGKKEEKLSDAINAFGEVYEKLTSDGIYNEPIRCSFINYVLSCAMALLFSCKSFENYKMMYDFLRNTSILKNIRRDDIHYYQQELFDTFMEIRQKDIDEFLFSLFEANISQRFEYVVQEKSIPEDYCELLKDSYRLSEILESKTYKLANKFTTLLRKVF